MEPIYDDNGYEPGPNDFPQEMTNDDPILPLQSVAVINCQYCSACFMTIPQKTRHEKACGKEPANKPLNAVKISNNIYAVRKIVKVISLYYGYSIGS